MISFPNTRFRGHKFVVQFFHFRPSQKKETPPIIGRTCTFGTKNRVILGWSKFVSRYVERDKKNVEKFDFCY